MNQIRIIGGQYRGRKLSFRDTPDLRPTPSRIRETLFNWLAPHIVGATCLDLFAGSGALSFEAISRGAAHALAIEKDTNDYFNLLQNAEKLTIPSEKLELIQADSLKWLHKIITDKITTIPPFDIVFVDPPYSIHAHCQCLNYLQQSNLIKPLSFIYFENNEPLDFNLLPQNFKIIREKKAGLVYYGLAQVN